MDEYVEEELQEAHDTLVDAEIMYQNEVSKKAVVSRLYYACFYAARAVLHAKGFDPNTHQGLMRIFGREVVNTGDATGEDGRFLNDMRTRREKPDYSHNPITADIDELRDNTKRFIADMEDIVE